MLVFYKISELKKHLSALLEKQKTIGFTPTMGALHQGHISLIKISQQQCDVSICSIFVNPTQFNNPDDLKRYPRTPDDDIKLLEQAGCDVLYMPEVADIYPTNNNRQFSFGYLDSILEGSTRPGHYNGVGQVVSILLEGILPHKAFFGSKDYQQVMVVKELVKQLKLPVEIISCPILREDNGLAMSSRNALLNQQERIIASLVPQIMKQANEIVKTKGVLEAKHFVNEITSLVSMMKLNYFEVCDARTLEIKDSYSQHQQYVSLIAVFVGKVRLIDNWLID